MGSVSLLKLASEGNRCKNLNQLVLSRSNWFVHYLLLVVYLFEALKDLLFTIAYNCHHDLTMPSQLSHMETFTRWMSILLV
jgi:hypothetical protein